MKLTFKLQIYFEHPNARRSGNYNIPHILHPEKNNSEFSGYIAWVNIEAADDYDDYVNSKPRTWIKYKIKKL